MEIYRDQSFWDDYYEKNKQYVGKNRKLGRWTVLKDRRMYEDNGYAMERLASGAYDRIRPEMFRKKWGSRVRISPPAPGEKTVFHSYWCGEIGEKQAFSIKSCLCTQPPEAAELWLWLDRENGYEGYADNAYLKPLLPFIKVLPFDADEEIQGTPYEKAGWMFHGPELTFRADGFRLLELYKRGGVYFDLDVLFLKSLSPVLAAGEFCYTWEWQPYGNNALLYLRQGSLLNERITKKALMLETFRPWRLLVYQDRGLSSYIVYPSAFFDPLWQKRKEEPGWIHSFEEFFTAPVLKEGASSFTLENQPFFPGAYAHHWHNQWKTEPAEGSVYRWFERQFDEKIRHMREEAGC